MRACHQILLSHTHAKRTLAHDSLVEANVKQSNVLRTRKRINVKCVVFVFGTEFSQETNGGNVTISVYIECCKIEQRENAQLRNARTQREGEQTSNGGEKHTTPSNGQKRQFQFFIDILRLLTCFLDNERIVNGSPV